MHDLAESLIVEAGIGQSRDAEVRLVQCVAPSPDPVFVPIAFVGCGGFRDAGHCECAGCEQRKGHPPKRNPHGLTVSSTCYWLIDTLVCIETPSKVIHVRSLIPFMGLRLPEPDSRASSTCLRREMIVVPAFNRHHQISH